MSRVVDHAKPTIEVPVCTLSELPLGTGRVVDVGSRVIAVFRSRDGSVHALDNRCPHGGGSLGNGVVMGRCVVCPTHSYRYDLQTGSCNVEKAWGVEVYPVRTKGDWVVVTVPAR